MNPVAWASLAGLAALGLGFSLRFTFWRPDLPGVPILMYHFLTDNLYRTKLKKLRVSPRTFYRQLDFLGENGYKTINLHDLHRSLRGGTPLPEKPVVITFDDGDRESVLLARDALSARGFFGVVFIVSSRIGQTNDWDRGKGEPEFELLRMTDLLSLTEDGWDVGSHGWTHSDLTGKDDQTLTRELSQSKSELEALLGREVIALSYPYGLNDRRVREAAQKAGYKLGLTTRHGKNVPGDDPWSLKRIIIKRKDLLLDFSLKLGKGRSTL
ncbi:MAG: polysaccharide deacetylase family protein [Pseudomonadota bacterium]